MTQTIKLRHGESEHMKVHHYPDGQKNITLKLDMLNVKEPVEILCSIRNFNELEILLCLVAALRKNDFCIRKIKFVYLFGMRSDRAFEAGMPNYFRDVVAPIINSLEVEAIWICHPHSSAAINHIGIFPARVSPFYPNEDYIIIWADNSSSKFFEYLSPYKFNKIRMNGLPTVEMDNDLLEIGEFVKEGKGLIICDDLIDGGATFIEEAKYLRERFPEIKLSLYVTHAIFSKGVDIVADHFDEIICTNSYQDISHPKVKQIEVI